MISLLALFPVTVMAQEFKQESLVYIECFDSSNTRVSRGSGVIVSSDGRVLTAKHVVKGNSCRASLGTGATMPSRSLIRGRASSVYDAVILKLVPLPGEVFQAVRYTRIAALQRKSITAYGVPIDGTGQVSVRTGVISTTITDSAGHIQTDALTARGMSGGPVVLDETRALVGIVVGADVDVTSGLPTNYAVLAAEEVAAELGLAEIEVGRVTRGGGRADYTYHYNHEGRLYAGHFAQQEGGNWIEYGTDPRGVQFNFAHEKTEAGFIYLFDASRTFYVRIPLGGGWSEASGDGKNWNRLHHLTLQSNGSGTP
jgi:S1-C subfamily serine protease